MRNSIIKDPEDVRKLKQAKAKEIKKVSEKFDKKIDKLNEKYEKNAISEIKILNANFNKITKTNGNWIAKKSTDFKQQVAGRLIIIMKVFTKLDDHCVQDLGHHLYELSPKVIDDLTAEWTNGVSIYKSSITSADNQQSPLNNQQGGALNQQNRVANGAMYNQN